MKLRRMRKTTIAKPKLLVEIFRVDDQRIPFPAAYRAAVVERMAEIPLIGVQRIPAVGIDEPPIVIAAADEDPNSLPVWLLNKLNSITKLELPRSTGRLAKKKPSPRSIG